MFRQINSSLQVFYFVYSYACKCDEYHSLWPSDAIWQHGSGLKLLPDGTNPLPELIPASIATLAQRQPLRWANVGSPTLVQCGFVNWSNVGAPTLALRSSNGCMSTLYQPWPNGGCVTGFLWGEPIVHRWIPLTKGQERWHWCLPKQSVEQTVELRNRWFETPMWLTSM